MKKILVIEDERDVREIILDILEAEEFSVRGAENGKEGIKFAKEYLPDLVICDVMMPEINGYDVLKNLRKNKATSTTPFIFLTAKATKADLRQGMNLGADDYLTKPFTRQELLNSITSRIQKQAIFEQKTQERLDELRNSITLSLPHELRTPLNGILASSQLLMEDFLEMEADEVYQMLGDIQTSAQRLYRQISNFLLYTDLELLLQDQERLKSLAKGSVKSPNLVVKKAAVQLLQSSYPERQSDLKLQLKKMDSAVNASEEFLSKIVEELIDNAFKFSKVGQNIQLKTQVLDQSYCLEVQDQGRGMTAEKIANLGAYKKFNRQQYEEGSGLGLAIVKRLVELNSGTLDIQSIPEKMTKIRVTLPLA